MSKIIRIRKCEGFCKNRIADPNPEGGQRTDCIHGTDESVLLCTKAHWYLYHRDHEPNWFKRAFMERCPFMTKEEYKAIHITKAKKFLSRVKKTLL